MELKAPFAVCLANFKGGEGGGKQRRVRSARTWPGSVRTFSCRIFFQFAAVAAHQEWNTPWWEVATPSHSHSHTGTLALTAVGQTAYEISQYCRHFRVACRSLVALHLRSRAERTTQNTGFSSPRPLSSAAGEVHFTGWVNMYSSSLLLCFFLPPESFVTLA